MGLFEAKIRKINQEKMTELEEKLILEYNVAKKDEELKVQTSILKETPLEVLDREDDSTPAE